MPPLRWWRYGWILKNPYAWQPWAWRDPFECPVCLAVLPSLWQAMVHVDISDARETLDG